MALAYDGAMIADTAAPSELPRWSVADVHESLDSRSFTNGLEEIGAGVSRLVGLFDEHDVRSVESRELTPQDGMNIDSVLNEYNRVSREYEDIYAYVYATVSTDSRHERAQSLMSELDDLGAKLGPLSARLADWSASLGVAAMSAVSPVAADHEGPLSRLAVRSAFQMSESEEGLYAELSTTGSGAWSRLHGDVTSQLSTNVELPNGDGDAMPMPAVRGLATDSDPAVRKAAYEAEQRAWPTVATPIAAAMNAIKGEANAVNRRRGWSQPLDVSLHGNSVSHATFDAMQAAVTDALPDFQRWMRVKAKLHGHDGGLPWWDLVAPLPFSSGAVSWDEGIGVVRDAFSDFSPSLGGLVDRALNENWIDAPAADGKTGGAFCLPFVDDRSLVLLNWSGSAESAQTTAHELGHAYHNTTMAGRTAMQRDMPMALAETASIFCETLVVEAGLERLSGVERLALLDIDLQGTNQVIVDIRSRFLFETEVFARRQRRTLGVAELNEMMVKAQLDAYGDGIDQSTAHPYMWLLKPHYYSSSHFYNWPYTYGLLFGLGLFARYREDPIAFRSGYDDLLSRAGMDTAEQLGAAFDLDVTDKAFWTASLDVVRRRMTEYENLATELGFL